MLQRRRCAAAGRAKLSQRPAVSSLGLVRGLVLAGGVLLGGALAAQWTQATPATHPSARTDAAIAYDPGRRTTFLFGGFPGTADTHAWDGSAWQQVASSGPPAMWGAAMAHEAQSGGMLLFGGKTAAAPVGETWRWNGTAWTRVFPAATPAARYDHAMAYDPVRARIVLFGGQTAASSFLGDTWEWDGTTWLQRASAGPTPRGSHGMAWDPRRGTVLLFGGTGASGARNDTWEWNGTSWTQIANGGPPANESARLATVGANVALFVAGSLFAQQTWIWNGASWTQATSAAQPGARTGGALAPDVHGAVLFGGYNVILGHLQDTWTLSVPTTRLTLPASAVTLEGNALLPLGGSNRRRMQTVVEPLALNPRVGLLHGAHLRRDAGATIFLGRDLDLRVTLGVAATTPVTMSTTFQNNWAGTPTLVFQGRTSIPPSLGVQPGPAPFHIALPFGNTFAWNAQRLAIEFEVVAASLTTPYDLDAVSRPFSVGTVTGTGQSCAGALGPPSLQLPSAADLVTGGTIDIGLAAARPGAIAFSFLGDSDTSWLGIPLPFPWPGTSCNVYHNWVVSQSALVGANGTARAVYPIPPQPHLSGTRLFSQWGVYEGAGSPPLVTTSMARMTIGPVPPALWDTISNADGSATGVKATGAWVTPVLQLDLD